MGKLVHLGLSVEDHVSVELDINGVRVLVEVYNDVTVTAIGAGLKVAEQLNYGTAQAVRINIVSAQVHMPTRCEECNSIIGWHHERCSQYVPPSEARHAS